MDKEEVVNRFGRLLVPMLTAFKQDGELDPIKSQEIAEYIIEEKLCDSLIVGGTTGEFFSMNFAERVNLFKAIKEVVKSRVPLIAGTGAVSTKETIELTRAAEELGYDMAMIVAPYYCKPTQKEIENHYRKIASATNIPIMLYNIPLFSGANIEPKTVERLKDESSIVAIKEEAEINPLQSTRYIIACEDKLAVYSGDDSMIIQILAQGGVGGVSGTAQVVGKAIREMINSFLSGDVKKATDLHHKIYPFIRSLTQNDRKNPIPLLKFAFSVSSGIDAGLPRPPLLPPSEDEKAVILEVMRKVPYVELKISY
ncbi:4-hydroxy-tetrahydrodipicolinate synthase [bacterium]|nr:4-hydroxy-tetrahydrodipicolinate synthase [bacterium]